jgi:hypothetical protein
MNRVIDGLARAQLGNSQRSCRIAAWSRRSAVDRRPDNAGARRQLSYRYLLRQLVYGASTGGKRLKREAPWLSGFLERRADVEGGCTAQVARMGVVVWTSAMHRTTVIPDYEIADPPFMAVNEFGPGCVQIKVVEQDAALGHWPADDVRGMRRKVQRLPLRAGMAAHQPLL